MSTSSNTVSFTFHFFQRQMHITTCIGEYRSLMELLSDKLYMDEFGECKGTGRCGTCLVSIENESYAPSKLDRNEGTTLRKMGIKDSSVRLSCQIAIDDELSNRTIFLVEV